jgi:hypothetical protein
VKAWIFVEGPADVRALEALFSEWRMRLRADRKGIQVIDLQDKSKYLRKFGRHAAEKLAGNPTDVVVGLPDLYPSVATGPSQYQHSTLEDLMAVQLQEVHTALVDVFHMNKSQAESCLDRLHASALKHDLEMLLLAAEPYLAQTLQKQGSLGNWRHPVEEQNFDRPPKRVVEEVWRRHSPKKHAYRDTLHAQQVLKKAAGNIGSLLHDKDGKEECPVFKQTLDWISAKTGVTAY